LAPTVNVIKLFSLAKKQRKLGRLYIASLSKPRIIFTSKAGAYQKTHNLLEFICE
jgi:hypothetical protein